MDANEQHQMRIAICFSGQIRTGVEASMNIKHFIGELYPYCDFFIHTWDINSSKPLFNPSIDLISENVDVIKKTPPESYSKIYEIYSPKKMMIDTSVYDSDKIPFYFSWKKSVEYKIEYEIENNFTYDYVVKLRFDAIYSPEIQLNDYIQLLEPKMIISEGIWVSGSMITINDIIYISDSVTMDIAIKWVEIFFPNWRDIVSKFGESPGSHAYFARYLIQNGIYPYSSRMSDKHQIAIYRPETLQYNSLTEFEKCFESDRFNYWGWFQLLYLTKDELKRDIEITKQLRGYVPECMYQFSE